MNATNGWVCFGDGYYAFFVNGSPVVAMRFETSELNASRYLWDQKNYEVWSWNSWVRDYDGSSRHLRWDENTDIGVMQAEILRSDSRVSTPEDAGL